MNGESGTLPSARELVVVAPRSSAFAEAQERTEPKDTKKLYSLPPPTIEPWDGSDVGERVGYDDPAEELNRLTLSDNITERERAKTWMRTAIFHAKDAAIWKEKASQEFARAERFIGPKANIRTYYYVAFFAMGATMYEIRWLVVAAFFFTLGIIWDLKTKKDTK